MSPTPGGSHALSPGIIAWLPGPSPPTLFPTPFPPPHCFSPQLVAGGQFRVVKEPLGFVKVLQWVSLAWAVGGGRAGGGGDGGDGLQRSRGVRPES